MKVDYDSLKKIKKLGEGVFSKVYLVEIDSKKYVLKKQHIKKSYANISLDDRLHVYNIIKKLPKNQSIFFSQYIDYKKNNKIIDWIVEYKGKDVKTVLETKIDEKVRLSLLLQSCIIYKILVNKDLINNDMSFRNLTVLPTKNKILKIEIGDKKYITKINKYILSLIDYGDIQNLKKQNYYYFKFGRKQFQKIKQYVILNKLYEYIFHTICPPYDTIIKFNVVKGLKNIYKNHPDFWFKYKSKIKETYPLIGDPFSQFENTQHKEKQSINNESQKFLMNMGFYRMIDIFQLHHPKLLSKYLNKSRWYKATLDKEFSEQLLFSKDIDSIICLLKNRLR